MHICACSHKLLAKHFCWKFSTTGNTFSKINAITYVGGYYWVWSWGYNIAHNHLLSLSQVTNQMACSTYAAEKSDNIAAVYAGDWHCSQHWKIWATSLSTFKGTNIVQIYCCSNYIYWLPKLSVVVVQTKLAVLSNTSTIFIKKNVTIRGMHNVLTIGHLAYT